MLHPSMNTLADITATQAFYQIVKAFSLLVSDNTQTPGTPDHPMLFLGIEYTQIAVQWVMFSKDSSISPNYPAVKIGSHIALFDYYQRHFSRENAPYAVVCLQSIIDTDKTFTYFNARVQDSNVSYPSSLITIGIPSRLARTSNCTIPSSQFSGTSSCSENGHSSTADTR